MEGGIAILLLLIIAVVGGGLAIALYVTGGALWFGKTDKEGDRVEGQERFERRPEHKEVSAPHLEHSNFGTRDE